MMKFSSIRPGAGETRRVARGSAALRRLWPAVVLLALLALAAGCPDSGPVRIGFCGPLTGVWSDVGVQGRNGATLAVEDLNARGGVAGRPVELVVADEKDTPEGAVAAVQELDRRGAAVLVGFMTSSAARAGLPAAEAAGLAVVSPTATTSQLSGRMDALYRVDPDTATFARFQADGVAGRDRVRRVLAVLDQDNPVFAESYAWSFAERFAQHGGQVAGTIRLPHGAEPDGLELARGAAAANATGILALLPARTLARLVLQLRPVAPGLRVYASMTGFNTEFLEMAGRIAEGVASCLVHRFDQPPPAMAGFIARYQDRFGFTPSSGALLAFEATMIASLALERTRGQRQGVAQALDGLGKVPGLDGDIGFDRFGDVVRPLYWAEVRDGAIRTRVDGRD